MPTFTKPLGKRASPAFRRFAGLLLLAWAIRVSACSPEIFSWNTYIEEVTDPNLIRIVDDYIGEKYKWKRNEYYISLDGLDSLDARGGDIVSVGVMHRDDVAAYLKSPGVTGGGPNSFSLEVDQREGRVIRQLSWQ